MRFCASPLAPLLTLASHCDRGRNRNDAEGAPDRVEQVGLELEAAGRGDAPEAEAEPGEQQRQQRQARPDHAQVKISVFKDAAFGSDVELALRWIPQCEQRDGK